MSNNQRDEIEAKLATVEDEKEAKRLKRCAAQPLLGITVSQPVLSLDRSKQVICFRLLYFGLHGTQKLQIQLRLP